MDYVKQEVCSAQKSIRKLKHTWNNRTTWTNRGFAAHMGVLLFISGVLRLNFAKYFSAFKLFRTVSSMDDWDAPFTCSPSALESLKEWTEEALLNKPRPLQPRPQTFRRIIFVDASKYGWGAVSVDTELGTIDTHGAKWIDFKDARKSARAEPEAVFMAACRFARPNLPTLFVTDSITARSAFTSRRSPSFSINAIVNRFVDKFPGAPFFYIHIPGIYNPADSFSRGLVGVNTAEQTAIGLEYIQAAHNVLGSTMGLTELTRRSASQPICC